MITAEGTLVLYGDGAGEAARRMLPGLPDACFIPLPEAVGEAVAKATKNGSTRVVLVAGVEDQTRILGGVPGVLVSITLDMDGGGALAAEVAAAATARAVYDLWEAAGRLGPCGRELCRRTAGELERLAAAALGSANDASNGPANGGANGGVAAQVVLVDPAGERMVGMFGRMAR
ncbi:hypothetical protein BZB76_2571 [Actinomadura pelletieri DSM 43383]|uniref:Uncharacterized protein n=1 Tax=Actinomadura pelletieri DSM 43383 TaxID=1120940 RepID=A0A495QUK3_9ACTN|nr:hypothetical protein [Actinomadura pelletieri]RKS77194.1 hypothetical protein BZB76_2571 [Actinomadura pelletieri DSM 43383]